MNTKIEGLILKKTPYQERHLICHLLLRSGKKVSVLFYGGKGGGKNKKSSILEIGHMIKVELRRTKSTSELYNAKEWNSVWIHDLIRSNHQAFYLLCLYLEIILKLSVFENLHDEHASHDESTKGLFRVLSNGIFFIEKKLKENHLDIHFHLVVFLSKLLAEQGLFPGREKCVLSDMPLSDIETLVLTPEHGGFADSSLVNFEDVRAQGNGVAGKELWFLLGRIMEMKYQETRDFSIQNKEISRILFQFFCFQFHFEDSHFKSVSMIL